MMHLKSLVGKIANGKHSMMMLMLKMIMARKVRLYAD